VAPGARDRKAQTLRHLIRARYECRRRGKEREKKQRRRIKIRYLPNRKKNSVKEKKERDMFPGQEGKLHDPPSYQDYRGWTGLIRRM